MSTQRPASTPFDIAEMRRRLGGDEELVRDIVGLFLEDYPVRMAAIQSAIDSGQADGIRRAAHALKGGASTMSAFAVAEAAGRIEASGEAGDLASVGELFAELTAEMERLAAVLRELHDARS